MLRGAAAGQAHGQAQPLPHDGPLQEHIVAVVAHLTGNDFIGQFLNALIHRPFGVIGHAGHFPENPVTNLLDPGLNTSHGSSVLPCVAAAARGRTRGACLPPYYIGEWRVCQQKNKGLRSRSRTGLPAGCELPLRRRGKNAFVLREDGAGMKWHGLH